MTTPSEGALDERASTALLERIFPGDSEIAELMRATDWSHTPLGSPTTWSPSLCMMVRLLLTNRFPLLLWWGPSFCQLYNAPYRPVLGTKHPVSMGQPASECWPEIWDVIGPLIETPFNGGPATWSDDIFLEVNRHGFVEETHFTIAYSPIPDDSVPNGIGGVLATVHEISDKVVAERRVLVLRDLGARSSEAKSAEEACQIAAQTLAQHPKDIPFALLYLLDSDGTCARLAGTTGVKEQDRALCPPTIALEIESDDRPGIDLTAEYVKGRPGDRAGGSAKGKPPVWPLADILHTQALHVVDGLASRFAAVPAGPWADPPDSAVVVPIHSASAHQLAGFLIAGVSTRLRLDDAYTGFYELVSSQIATAIAHARAYEDERRRAEGLAAIDRAKTAFFSNVSHEFRTPLTLLLGPLEDSLTDTTEPLAAHQRERLLVMRRNGLRLLKLVNTLLDFARIEAGRAQAIYEPTDLASATADLASSFRSLVEKAGIRLVVDCPPLIDLREPVYVDREMWDKVVLNLLSNAFKFTFAGAITVRLRTRDSGRQVELEVRDTGVGIPAAELPQLFERFHRVEGTRARTHEGSGIGLALVHDLVQLHGGTIRAQSREGTGTAFFVRVPAGTKHLSAERIGTTRQLAPTTLGASAYLEEAARWLPDDDVARDGRDERNGVVGLAAEAEAALDGAASPGPANEALARLLLADDNADMRDYLRRLLAERYAVEAVANGREALDAIQRAARNHGALPDLVLSDVMMPELDGFGLLRALRADPTTRAIPVILLSARAGEEATVEGLEAGADDYLVKPFSAREVLTRVGARLEIARARRAAEAHARDLETTFEAIADAVFLYDSAGQIVRTNAAARTLFDLNAQREYATSMPEERAALIDVRDERGQPIPAQESGLARLLRGESLTGTNALDVRVRLPNGREVDLNIAGAPLTDEAGAITGAIAISRDVTRRRQLERDVRASEQRLRAILELLPVGVAFVDASGKAWLVNEAIRAIWGSEMPLATAVADYGEYKAWWPATGKRVAAHEWGLARALATGAVSINAEMEIEAFDGTRKTILCSDAPVRDEAGAIVGGMSVIVDISERKHLERRTREALDALLELAAAMVSERSESLDRHQEEAEDDDLYQFASLCTRVLGCERIAVIAVDPETESLRAVAMTGSSGEVERRFRAGLLGTRLADRFGSETTARLLAGETVLVKVDRLPEGDPAHILSRRLFLMAPMLAQGALYGYLGVSFGDDADLYTAANRALALAAARMVGLVMERTRLTRERAQARTREVALTETARRMDEFLGIASHELRTPLTSITANVQIAGRQLLALRQERARHGEPGDARNGLTTRLERCELLLERTDRQLGRLGRLVSDLLDVTRIQAGKLEMRREECDLLEVVREVVLEQQAAWPQRSVALTATRHAHVLVHGDADRIGQVVTNYLTNALKYSEASRPVTVRVRVRAGMARVEVRDRGPGLTPEQRVHLFERFYRVPGIEQQSGSGVGLGLGLHICKTIVERHDGQVGVESIPREGSTFWFTIPLSEHAHRRAGSKEQKP